MLKSLFLTRPTRTAGIMFTVLAVLVPGIVAYVLAFGVGVLVQILLATVSALLAEAVMLRLRGQPLRPSLGDLSAVVTAWLLALSLPPLAPWWLVVTGTVFAIVLAKQVYGGLGNNLFNPAMVGFAVLIVCFPALMSQWPAPRALAEPLPASEQIAHIFAPSALDTLASATPLDTLKTGLHAGQPLDDILSQPTFGPVGGAGCEWIIAAYLLGGLFLCWRGLVPWQLPLGFLAGLALTAALFQWAGVEGAVSPWLHLGSGATVLGAFFILSDPVTAPATPRGRLIYAVLAGLLCYLIRVFGAYPDGVAFAVLIMNIAVPFIDQHTQPPVFGRKGGGR